MWHFACSSGKVLEKFAAQRNFQFYFIFPKFTPNLLQGCRKYYRKSIDFVSKLVAYDYGPTQSPYFMVFSRAQSSSSKFWGFPIYREILGFLCHFPEFSQKGWNFHKNREIGKLKDPKVLYHVKTQIGRNWLVYITSTHAYWISYSWRWSLCARSESIRYASLVLLLKVVGGVEVNLINGNDQSVQQTFVSRLHSCQVQVNP